MKTKFIEATNQDAGGINWGKFMLGRFDEAEWSRQPKIVANGVRQVSLLRARGWDTFHLLVLDLETGEGAIFRPGGSAAADLHKHKIWVCPLFEPFLQWLYKQDLRDLDILPDTVDLDAPGALFGYRRTGAQMLGKIGGLARAKALPEVRRQEIARKAAKARWEKERNK